MAIMAGRPAGGADLDDTHLCAERGPQVASQTRSPSAAIVPTPRPTPTAGDAARPAHAPDTGRRSGWYAAYLRRLIPLDIAVAVLAALAGALIRTGDGTSYLWLVPVVVVAWLGLLAASDAYGRRRLTIGAYQLRVVGRAATVGVALVAVLAYLTRIAPARGYLLLVVPLLVVGSAGARLALRTWLRRRRGAGRLLQTAVIVGRADSAAALVTSLRSDASQGLRPIAVCAITASDAHRDSPAPCSHVMDARAIDARAIDVRSTDARSTDARTTDVCPADGCPAAACAVDALPVDHIAGVPVLGEPDAVLDVVDATAAEVVVVAAHPDLSGPVLRRLTWALEERGVELVVSPGLLDVAGPRLSIRPSAHLSLLHVERPAGTRAHDVAKGVFDRLWAAALLVVLAPVLLGAALAVRLGDLGDLGAGAGRGAVLFRQQRVGVRGEPFTMYKFRTMVPDAESRLEALLATTPSGEVLFKMVRDPRITRVGAVLRRYSIDELPQLLNVLRGDMSLVGPRPPLPREVAQYEPDALRRLRVRPGMTGLWQVSGRSDLSWEQSLRLDLHYVDNWSPLGDLHILVRTLSAVLRGSGAY